MSQDSKTVLVWTYEPHNFFEEEVLIVWLGGEITITDGSVRGTFDSKYYSEGIDFRDKVHDVVHSHFHAQQVQIQTSFELSPASMSREHADGRRDATVFVETMRLQLTGFPIDIVTRDAKGNVVTDTRAIRINKQKKFGGDVLRLLPNDPTLKQLLQSFDNALRDKDNILIHLYEIKEAISVEYGGEANAIAATNVTKTKWSRFGQMANNDPLLEGRHRGKHTNLRNSTEEEISFAKDFAKTLVEGYVANKVGKIT